MRLLINNGFVDGFEAPCVSMHQVAGGVLYVELASAGQRKRRGESDWTDVGLESAASVKLVVHGDLVRVNVFSGTLAQCNAIVWNAGLTDPTVAVCIHHEQGYVSEATFRYLAGLNDA